MPDEETERTDAEKRALTVQCPDCMAPVNVSCGDQPHADRIRDADLRTLEHGRCALCGQPMVRGSVAGAPVDAWHPDETTAALCPRIPDPKDDWEGYAMATNLGLTPGHPGPENFVPAGEQHEVIAGEVLTVLGHGADQRDPHEALVALAQDIVDSGDGTPAEVAAGLSRALTDPVTEPLSTTGPDLLAALQDSLTRARQDRSVRPPDCSCPTPLVATDPYCPVHGYTQATAPPPALCPECVNGKCVNCVGQALDPVTDDLVPCACTHGTMP